MKTFLTLLLCVIAWLAYAANFENLPTTVTQPDGSELQLLASGDEYVNRLHDVSGFTVIQSPTDGFYYYAVYAAGEPSPSQWRADISDPISLGLPRNVTVSPQVYRARVEAMQAHPRRGSRGPNTGTVNNLTVYIRFSDQTEFTEPRSSYDAKFNALGDDAFSLRNYFHKVSYNQLDYVTHHYPTCAPEVNLSYQDSNPRAYYMPYNAITNPQGYRDWQRTDREHALLANALNAIAAQVPATLNIDADNDGYVDNVCFIIRGPHAAWAELLWAHRWALYTQDVMINGKMVWDFTFQPENQNNVRTLCHEMFHSVGAPDLYHYTYNGITPAGCWDIMESGGGHMGMYMKYRYGGWIADIPVINPGLHTLNPVTMDTNSAYRIPLSGGQYLVVEYRQQGSDVFEAGLPGSGILIYRINPDLSGNAEGPPDEVYVFRPGGTMNTNGQIADAAFSFENFRTAFNAYTDPACFLTGGGIANVNIHSISLTGETMSFYLDTVSNPYHPVISALNPASGTILTQNDLEISCSVTTPSGYITQVEFLVDGELISTATQAPFSAYIPAEMLAPGYHNLSFRASNSAGMTTLRVSEIRVVDPQIATWFSWMTDTPVWDSYGRGAIPIRVALDMDIGEQEYVVKKLAFHALADPWGFPADPGRVNVKINRFANANVTEQTLVDLGDVYHSMDGRNEFVFNSDVPISGKIAIVLNMYEYQRIVFDTAAPCGKSWITEPNRTWTDALGRGITGAAAIEVQLQSPFVSTSDPLTPGAISGIRCYPNPFRQSTSFELNLKSSQSATLSVYNLRGQMVYRHEAGQLPGGVHTLTWEGRDNQGRSLSNGIYLYKLQAGGESRSGRIVYLK